MFSSLMIVNVPLVKNVDFQFQYSRSFQQLVAFELSDYFLCIFFHFIAQFVV